jgi:UDPglucose 6-dehydrogenase
VGVGKLGKCVAVALANQGGHDVMGYDIWPDAMTLDPPNYHEAGPDGTGSFADELAKTTLRFGTLEEVVEHSEIIYIAVQTPHDPRFEGIAPLPDDRADFDYSFLENAVSALAMRIEKPTIIAVISTVMPGTMRREILPRCSSMMRLVYAPSFIALGETMRSFLHTPVKLFGGDDAEAKLVCQGISDAVQPGINKLWSHHVSFEEAELAKVAYNAFITTQITFANTMMECADACGANVDKVMRVIESCPRYLTPGMGEGGPCRPRDLVALSWFKRKQRLSGDFFGALAHLREIQTLKIASIAAEQSEQNGLPVVILGYAYKPGSAQTVGSPALLLSFFLPEATLFDPIVQRESVGAVRPAVYVIGCRHPTLAWYTFPKGSIVIDPHRYVQDQEGVTVIRLGDRQ